MKYKIYIQRYFQFIMGKKKSKPDAIMVGIDPANTPPGSLTTLTIDGVLIPIPVISSTGSIDIPPALIEPPSGKIDGMNWVWPDGKKTNLRFIHIAVSKMKNLPKGFYAEVERLNTPNLNLLAAKAKSLNLKDDVAQ